MVRKMGAGKLLKDENDIIREMVEKKKGRKGKGKDEKKEDRLPQHKHCIICFRAINLDKDYCSGECEMTHSIKVKKQKRMVYMMYGILAVVFVFILLSGYLQ